MNQNKTRPQIKNRKIFGRVPFYVLFIGVYPVLFLWLANFGKVHSYVVPRSLLISAGFTVFVFLITWLFVRPASRAGLVSGLWLILFYTYGHLFSLIDNASLFGFIFGRHRFIIPLWLLIGSTGTYFLLRGKRGFRKATRIANFVFAVLTVIVLVQINILAFANQTPVSPAPTDTPAESSSSNAPAVQRDVYYIVLDGYDRADLMKKDLELDIQPFLDELKKLGFIIPACGQSNYTDTAMSMAATFNMDYLDKLGFTYEELATRDHEKLLAPLIKNSIVRQTFHQKGYKFITYKSPYLFIDMPDSDVYLDAETATDPGEKLETLNFQQLFINTTFARTAAEWLVENPYDSSKMPVFLVWLISPGSLNPESSTFVGRNYKQYRENVYQLDNLETIPDIPGKKFLYAHLLVTHQPFTFTANGEFRMEEKDSYESYKDQVRFINVRMVEIVKTILKKSSIPPVIILQSDHSYSDGGKRARNLQAYFLPEYDRLPLPDTFTNLNTFRLVLDTYFGENLALLPDQSYQVGKEIKGYSRLIPGSCMP